MQVDPDHLARLRSTRRKLKDDFPWIVPALVVVVKDGDTVDVAATLPNAREPRVFAVRVSGVDAPETTRRSTKDEAEIRIGLQVKEVVSELLTPGSLVWVRLLGLDKYSGRYVGEIEIPLRERSCPADNDWLHALQARVLSIHGSDRGSASTLRPSTPPSPPTSPVERPVILVGGEGLPCSRDVDPGIVDPTLFLDLVPAREGGALRVNLSALLIWWGLATPYEGDTKTPWARWWPTRRIPEWVLSRQLEDLSL